MKKTDKYVEFQVGKKFRLKTRLEKSGGYLLLRNTRRKTVLARKPISKKQLSGGPEQVVEKISSICQPFFLNNEIGELFKEWKRKLAEALKQFF